MEKITEVPSPFCGMGTDDLTIQVDGVSIKVIENGCAINTPAFEQPISDTQPRVDGKEVSLKEAVNRAAKILTKANQPVIGGCATDVNGMRALLALADRKGAVVDHLNFTATRRNVLAMQDSGWMNTTLAEIKNRCDLLLVIACDLETVAPRFYERYLWNDKAMFLDKPRAREVIYMGNTSVLANNNQAQTFSCDEVELPELLGVLRCLIKSIPITVKEVGGLTIAELKVIADKLKAANYGVIVWAANTLNFSQAELTVQAICELVKDVNDSGVRCSGFPLGGKEGDQTAHQVCGWQTGYPARMRFSSDIPEYDPFLYDTKQMLANAEVDALLWVQAFNSQALPPTYGEKIATIVVARSGMVFTEEPEVFIPIGTPGIDHTGHVFRLDNVVAIRLKKLRDSELPSTAEVLTAIENASVT